MILAGEEGFALEHLGEDATSTPDIDLDIVFLPSEHDLGGPVISGGNVAGHLRILDSRQAKVANLEIAVFVDKNVARLEIAMHNTRRVDILEAALISSVISFRTIQFLWAQDHQTYHDLVEEVLDELLFKWSRG